MPAPRPLPTEFVGRVVHRPEGRLHPENIRGVPVLGPDRTFVDCATRLSVGALVRVGDWLVATRQTDVLTLRGYVLTSHLGLSRRARRTHVSPWRMPVCPSPSSTSASTTTEGSVGGG